MNEDQHIDPSQDPQDTSSSTKGVSLEELQNQIEELQLQLKEANEKLLRAQADYTNLRQRSEKERLATIQFANEGFARDLIGCLDTFEQGMAHLPEDIATHEWVKGMVQFSKLLEKILKDHGVQKIVITTGETAFDPNMHEAISQEESEHKDVILEVFQDGYLHHDKVLRPAKVKVGC